MARLRRINTRERRASRRILATDVIPQGITRLASGHGVRLVNIALNGSILINSKLMLSPGSSVRLKLNLPENEMILEGRVYRCRVVGLKMAKIQYEAAILLENGLPDPLADKLRQVEDGTSAAECSSNDIHPKSVEYPGTAQLWVLDSQCAEAQA